MINYTRIERFMFMIPTIHIHSFFISNAFFNSASVLLNFFHKLSLKCSLGVAYTYNHHHSETLSLFTLFVSMTRSRSIYVISRLSDFYLHIHYDQSYNLMNIDICAFAYFLEQVLLFSGEECE